MKFPNLVYKCPGIHQCNGGTYEYLSVQNDEQLKAALILGWFSTLENAIEGVEPKVEPKVELKEEVSEVKEEISVSETHNEPLPIKEEEEVSVSELNKEAVIDYKNMSWNELRAYAKELEKKLDVEIIKQGSNKDSILNRIEEVLNED